MYLFDQQEIDAAVQVLASRQLFRYASKRREAIAFEKELATRLGKTHALLLSSGTAGLICAFAALKVGPGDEVIMPAYGFVADPLAVLAVGAVPVICEIDETLTIDPRDIERKITPRTRAILPIHMNGFPSHMDEIMAIARRHGLVVVEDACQSMGGTFRGTPLGAISDVGVFSFNQFKILSAGEGGAVVANDKAVFERAFIAHDGSCGYSPHEFGEPIFAGLAFRATELTAAILRVQLSKLDEILRRLRDVRDRTIARLGDGGGQMRRAPSHDREGECGTTIAYQFESPEAVDRFCGQARDAGLNAFRGDRYYHSYPEWDMLFSRLGGLHRLLNPIASRQYDPAACPATAAILGRTALLACTTDFDEPAIDKMSASLTQVASA